MPVYFSGPFFSPGAPALTREFIKRAGGAVADATHRKVNAFQSLLFRYHASAPTGYAHRSVQTLAMGDHHVVTDSGIVYGAWLEGVGSRNATTRFKGYAIFRRTTATMQNQAIYSAEPVIHQLTEALN